LCSLLRLFKGGGSAFVFDPGITTLFRSSLFSPNVLAMAFRSLFLAMIPTLCHCPFFIFDPGGIFVMFSSAVTSESNTGIDESIFQFSIRMKNKHVLKSRFKKAILIEDFRDRIQRCVSSCFIVSELRFEDFVCTLHKCFWGISFSLFKQIITFAEVGFAECVFCFCYNSLKLLAAPRYRSVFKSSFFWFRFCISCFDCISAIQKFQRRR
jgi:hypothetical protein